MNADFAPSRKKVAIRLSLQFAGIITLAMLVRVLQTVMVRGELVNSVGISLILVFGIMVIFSTSRSIQSYRRASHAQQQGGSIVVDAHCDSNLLAALREIDPGLGRLRESEALSRTLTLAFTPTLVEIWSGESKFRKCLSLPRASLSRPTVEQAELRERSCLSLAVTVTTNTSRVPIRFVLSQTGTSSFVKLNEPQLRHLITEISRMG